MNDRIALVIAFMLVMSGISRGAERPATRPADYVIGPMHVQTIPEMTYVYAGTRTTLAEIAQVVGKILPKLEATVAEMKSRPKGPVLFVYHGASPDPAVPFDVELGFPFAEDVKAPGDFNVKKLKEFRCATILLTGTMQHLGEAYMELFGQLAQAGYQPTGETREVYLYWDGPESANNVIQIQAGIR